MLIQSMLLDVQFHGAHPYINLLKCSDTPASGNLALAYGLGWEARAYLLVHKVTSEDV